MGEDFAQSDLLPAGDEMSPMRVVRAQSAGVVEDSSWTMHKDDSPASGQGLDLARRKQLGGSSASY